MLQYVVERTGNVLCFIIPRMKILHYFLSSFRFYVLVCKILTKTAHECNPRIFCHSMKCQGRPVNLYRTTRSDMGQKLSRKLKPRSNLQRHVEVSRRQVPVQHSLRMWKEGPQTHGQWRSGRFLLGESIDNRSAWDHGTGALSAPLDLYAGTGINPIS